MSVARYRPLCGPDQRACAAESLVRASARARTALRRAVGSRGRGFSPQTNAVADPDFAQHERPIACSRAISAVALTHEESDRQPPS
jgi:hypothetical protein